MKHKVVDTPDGSFSFTIAQSGRLSLYYEDNSSSFFSGYEVPPSVVAELNKFLRENLFTPDMMERDDD